jgi:hypothetical protein
LAKFCFIIAVPVSFPGTSIFDELGSGPNESKVTNPECVSHGRPVIIKESRTTSNLAIAVPVPIPEIDIENRQ